MHTSPVISVTHISNVYFLGDIVIRCGFTGSNYTNAAHASGDGTLCGTVLSCDPCWTVDTPRL